MLDQIKPSNGGNKQALKKAVLRDGIFLPWVAAVPGFTPEQIPSGAGEERIFHFPWQLEQIRGILNIFMFKGHTGK
jgi:hypothetical protein